LAQLRHPGIGARPNVGRPAGVIETAVAINPVIGHPMLSRGNEVANRTNLLRRMSPELADSVAKVFLSHRSRILRAIGAAIES
jgi:hypothetical protein